MKKLLLLIPVLAITLLTGCHEQIPAGTKGKILGKTGFQPELYPPSKVWVNTFFSPEKLLLVQTTTQKFNEQVNVKLAEEKLTVDVNIAFRGRINGSDKVLNTIFNDIPMNDNVVTTQEVYDVYARQLVMNSARSIISTYNVDELPKNYERITLELYQTVSKKLKALPIEISDITIGDVNYPNVVENSIKLATERRMAIEKEQAEVQIKLTEAKGREELAEAEYRIKMMQGKQIYDYNKLISAGITEDLLKLKMIELQEKQLDKWDGKLPMTLLSQDGSSGVLLNLNPANTPNK